MPLFEEANYPPKIGESKTITIRGVEKVQGESEHNFKTKTKDFGYHYLITLDDGSTMPMGTWKLYFAMKDAKVDVGDTILIKHPERGVYEVEKTKPLETTWVDEEE